MVAGCVEGWVGLAASQNHVARAVRLCGAAEALRNAMGAPLSPADRTDHDRNLDTLRAKIDTATYAATWAEGQALPREQASAYALEEKPDA